MIGYNFPEIPNIDVVLPAVKDHPSFSIMQKDGGYTVIQYNMLGDEVFPDTSSMSSQELRQEALRRECRGIVFDTITGCILSRPFHKFFNMGERLDMPLVYHRDFQVVEKLDGSLVRPVYLPEIGGIRWMTKRGITDYSMSAETYAILNRQYQDFAYHMAMAGRTPIFEWTSPLNRVVLNYQEERLTLLAVRDTIDGRYASRDELRKLAARYNLRLAQAHNVTDTTNLIGLRDFIRTIEGEEGVVVTHDDGHMVKIKSEWYVGLHRLKTGVEQEYTMVQILLNDGLDDILGLVDDPDIRDRVNEFAQMFRTSVDGLVEHVLHNVLNRFSSITERREFAERISSYPKLHQSLAFKAYGLGNDDEKRGAMKNALIGVLKHQSFKKQRWNHFRHNLELPDYVAPF